MFSNKLDGMIRFFLIAFLLIASMSLTAQTEVELGVGDTLFLKKPAYSTNYKAIDYIVKTRIEDTSATYDETTGGDFYEWFFKGGDFDVKRCPTKFQGMKARIATIHSFTDKGDSTKTRTVFICQVPGNKHAVLWVEIEDAMEVDEVGFVLGKRK